MKIFKNGFFAVLLSLVIVAASTLLSANMKLNKECSNVTEGFYSGVRVDGKLQPGIEAQLLEINRAAGNLAAAAARNGLDADGFAARIDNFGRELVVAHGEIAYIHGLYEQLVSDIISMGYELKEAPLNESDAHLVAESLRAVAAAREEIEASGYNDSVRAYINGLHFPARLFVELTGVKLPEYFA